MTMPFKVFTGTENLKIDKIKGLIMPKKTPFTPYPDTDEYGNTIYVQKMPEYLKELRYSLLNPSTYYRTPPNLSEEMRTLALPEEYGGQVPSKEEYPETYQPGFFQREAQNIAMGRSAATNIRPGGGGATNILPGQRSSYEDWGLRTGQWDTNNPFWRAAIEEFGVSPRGDILAPAAPQEKPWIPQTRSIRSIFQVSKENKDLFPNVPFNTYMAYLSTGEYVPIPYRLSEQWKGTSVEDEIKQGLLSREQAALMPPGSIFVATGQGGRGVTGEGGGLNPIYYLPAEYIDTYAVKVPEPMGISPVEEIELAKVREEMQAGIEKLLPKYTDEEIKRFRRQTYEESKDIIFDTIGKVVPYDVYVNDIEQAIYNLTSNPANLAKFAQDMLKLGRTTETELILRMLVPGVTDEGIDEFFAPAPTEVQPPVPPKDNWVLQPNELPLTSGLTNKQLEYRIKGLTGDQYISALGSYVNQIDPANLAEYIEHGENFTKLGYISNAWDFVWLELGDVFGAKVLGLSNEKAHELSDRAFPGVRQKLNIPQIAADKVREITMGAYEPPEDWFERLKSIRMPDWLNKLLPFWSGEKLIPEVGVQAPSRSVGFALYGGLETIGMFMPPLRLARTAEILNSLKVAERVALAQRAGLSGKAGSKAIEKLTQEEISAMAGVLEKEGKLVLPKTKIPKAAPGESEAGLAKGITPTEAVKPPAVLSPKDLQDLELAVGKERVASVSAEANRLIQEQGLGKTEAIESAIRGKPPAVEAVKGGAEVPPVKPPEPPVAKMPPPPEPTPGEIKALSNIPGKPQLTEAQVNRTLELFGKYVDEPSTANAWELTGALRREERAIRAEALKARASELIAKGQKPEEAINQAMSETMSGKLPSMTTDYLSDLTNEMRQVLFNRVYHTLKDEPYEMMSTIEALTNALAGRPIPRELGVAGGSAYTRLNRVFGAQPQVMKTIEKAAEEKKPLQDIVEGIFRQTPTEPRPPDAATMEYLRSLTASGTQTTTGMVPPAEGKGLLTFEPTGKLGLEQGGVIVRKDRYGNIIESRPLQQMELGKEPAALRASTLKVTGEILTPEEAAIRLQRFKTELAPAPTGLSAPFEPPIEKAVKELGLWPRPAIESVVKVLKEIGMSPVDIGGFIKAMKSSVDMSYWRQITPLIAGHPKRFALSNIEAWKALFSQKSAEASWHKIIHDPEEPGLYAIYAALQKKQGRDFLRPFDIPKGTAQYKGVEEFGYLTEERLIPRLTAKIPTIKWSNRAFVTGTNSDTWGIFKDFYRMQKREAERYASGTLKFKPGESFNMMKNMDDQAKYLAELSGRASLGKLSQMAPILGNLFYAPRYALGRVLGPRHLFSANPYIRKEAWKDAVLFVGTVGGVMLAGRQMGLWDVELNRNSADFMKIRVGNVRFDPWGGAQQFAVFFSRIVDLVTAPLTGKPAMGKSTITGQEYPLDITSLVDNFVKTKAAPLAGIIEEYLTGKTFGGEKVDIKNIKQWADRISPMALMDIWDALEDETANVATAGALSFVGLGVQTYSGRWQDNEQKIGLPKFDENLVYGLTEPRYDVKDFWADTASQFKGVNPAEITKAKGYPPKVIAIAEARSILDIVNEMPMQSLKSLNADPGKGDTFMQLYNQWRQRQNLGDDKKALADFDKKYPDAKLGNMSLQQYAILWAYHNLTDKKSQEDYLKQYPELEQKPREEYLKSHPEENAKLAVWGQAKVYTQKAYDKAMSLIKELDIPEGAVQGYLPPKKVAKQYFEYQDMLTKFAPGSSEVKLFRAQNFDFDEWLQKNEGLQKVEVKSLDALELTVKNRDKQKQYDEIKGRDLIQEKALKDAFLEANLDFAKDRIRIEGFNRGVPKNMMDDYVDYKFTKRKDYEDDWFLMEHPKLYRMLTSEAIMGDNALKLKDFSRVPTKEVYKKFQAYETLPAGEARIVFRMSNSDLEKWMQLTEKIKPIQIPDFDTLALWKIYSNLSDRAKVSFRRSYPAFDAWLIGEGRAEPLTAEQPPTQRKPVSTTTTPSQRTVRPILPWRGTPSSEKTTAAVLKRTGVLR